MHINVLEPAAPRIEHGVAQPFHNAQGTRERLLTLHDPIMRTHDKESVRVLNKSQDQSVAELEASLRRIRRRSQGRAPFRYARIGRRLRAA